MNKNHHLTRLPLLLALLLLTACTRSFDGGYNMPLLYKVDIQQGNVINQKMINQLKPGMHQDQVRFIMGTPTIVDPFHNDRWEYLYSFQEGGGVRTQRHITLHFNKEKLSHITGDIKINAQPEIIGIGEHTISAQQTVIVPITKIKEKGFFGRLWDKITPED